MNQSNRKSITTIILSLLTIVSLSILINNCTPADAKTSGQYLFYLHGGIVQQYGVNAVSQTYGAYDYLDILDTLRNYGYEVISERRAKGTEEEKYAEKVSNQIDSLLNLGIKAENIVVVGASQGAGIAIETAHRLRNDKIKYALLGICNEYNVNYYAKYRDSLCGNFLSIYESTDQKKSCDQLLAVPYCKSGYREITLDMGNGHGFLYKPYRDWVAPLVEWINRE